MQRHTKSQRSRRPRQRRATTPSIHSKSSTQAAQRQRAKRAAARRARKPRPASQAPRSPKTSSRKIKTDPAVALARLKASRERKARIAQETERIVMGDGQYVEERLASADASACAHHDLGVALDFSETSTRSPWTSMRATKRIAHDIFAQVQLSKQGTVFFPHYSSFLAPWASTPRRPLISSGHTVIEFSQCTSLSAAQRLASTAPSTPLGRLSSSVGVLSFASPKKPGGGYLHGGDDQEEILARYSSLVASLSSPAAQEFYKEHRQYRTEDGSGLHNHSMVYSPGVVVFRAHKDDAELGSSPSDAPDGAFIAPYTVDVVSAVPVNAAAVRAKHIILPTERQFFENGIRTAMKERMARALRVFEDKGDRVVVLGAFGCTSSENNIETVASIWAELLVCGEEGEKQGPFKNVFEKVVFAVSGKQFKRFKEEFEMRTFEAEVARAALSD